MECPACNGEMYCENSERCNKETRTRNHTFRCEECGYSESRPCPQDCEKILDKQFFRDIAAQKRAEHGT